MKMRSIITTILLSAAVVLSACSGGGKSSLASSANANSSVKSSSSEKVDIKIGSNGESGKITSGDASLQFGADLKWPKDQMKGLNEPKGKITGVMKDDKTGQCSVTYTEMKSEDAQTYVNSLKALGYSGGMNLVDKDGIMFSGTGSNGEELLFTYNVTAKEGMIVYTPNSQTSNVSANAMANQPKDMTDVLQWPNSFMKGVPELKGKIVDVVNNNNKYVTVSIEYVEKADFEAFLAQLKQNGYTVEKDETTSANAINYRAYNADGEWIRAYMSIPDKDATVEMEKPESSSSK